MNIKKLYKISLISCFGLLALCLILPIFPSYIPVVSESGTGTIILDGYFNFFSTLERNIFALALVVPMIFTLASFVWQTVNIFKRDRFSSIQAMLFSFSFLFITGFAIALSYTAFWIITAVMFVYLSGVTIVRINKEETD